VLRQVFVKVVRDTVQRVEARPGDRREVVVLVVQTDVVGEEVERSVVRVGLGKWDLVGGVRRVLLGLLENVVLGDEVACARMERSGEKAAHDQVAQCPSSCESNEREVESQLYNDVEKVDLGHWQGVNEHRSEGVEEDLECREEGLASD